MRNIITENKLYIACVKRRMYSRVSLLDEITVNINAVFYNVVGVLPIADDVIPSVF